MFWGSGFREKPEGTGWDFLGGSDQVRIVLNITTEASPCLSNDVLLRQCSTGHQSSTGPGAETKTQNNMKKTHTERKGRKQ